MVRLGGAALLVLAGLGLAACEPTEVGPGAPTRQSVAEAERKAALPKVELPPSIVASKSYRCSDNGILLVDWYSDGSSAGVRTSPDAAQKRLKAVTAGQAMVAEGGWSLSGSSKDVKVTFSSPAGRKPLVCKV